MISHVTFKDLFRIIQIASQISKHHKEFLYKSDYYLYILAVDPKYKGQGFASQLLKPMLKKFDKDNLICSLETNNPHNIKIYEHFGFTLDETIKVNKNLKDFRMLRKPQSIETNLANCLQMDSIHNHLFDDHKPVPNSIDP